MLEDRLSPDYKTKFQVSLPKNLQMLESEIRKEKEYVQSKMSRRSKNASIAQQIIKNSVSKRDSADLDSIFSETSVVPFAKTQSSFRKGKGKGYGNLLREKPV